jgi:hypothetical protein
LFNNTCTIIRSNDLVFHYMLYHLKWLCLRIYVVLFKRFTNLDINVNYFLVHKKALTGLASLRKSMSARCMFLLTRNFKLLTNFVLLTRNFDLISLYFELLTRNFELLVLKFRVTNWKFQLTNSKFRLTNSKFRLTYSKFRPTDSKFRVN